MDLRLGERAIGLAMSDRDDDRGKREEAKGFVSKGGTVDSKGEAYSLMIALHDLESTVKEE